MSVKDINRAMEDNLANNNPGTIKAIKTATDNAQETENFGFTAGEFTELTGDTNVVGTSQATATGAEPNKYTVDFIRSGKILTVKEIGDLLYKYGMRGDDLIAMILCCYKESKGNTHNKNDIYPDYSIGLFQINLLGHKPGHPGLTPPDGTKGKAVTLPEHAETFLYDPDNNTAFACGLYNSFLLSGDAGFRFSPWSIGPELKHMLSGTDDSNVTVYKGKNGRTKQISKKINGAQYDGPLYSLNNWTVLNVVKNLTKDQLTEMRHNASKWGVSSTTIDRIASIANPTV